MLLLLVIYAEFTSNIHFPSPIINITVKLTSANNDMFLCEIWDKFTKFDFRNFRNFEISITKPG